MPWVRAKLRGSLVFARADERGQLATEGGRVEIRYNPKDGRLYRAVAANLEVIDEEPLPDDTCAPAEPVERGAQRGRRAAKEADKGEPHDGLPEGTVVAYTDGACSGNPGPAGLGVVLTRDGERIELSEYLGIATNNIAELTAIQRALEELDAATPAVIYTDSSYSIGVLQKGWKAKANVELVAGLRELLRGRRVTLRYVRGHAGIPLNERADELARAAITRRSSERRVADR